MFFADDSMLGSWPSLDPHNFSQLKPNDPSNPSKMTLVTYNPTHDRTLPPPDQVITPEARNILLRHFYQHAEDKVSILITMLLSYLLLYWLIAYRLFNFHLIMLLHTFIRYNVVFANRLPRVNYSASHVNSKFDRNSRWYQNQIKLIV
ncbi:uncharacterized protein LOC131024990 isoform X1 [Salvia miltiorrhiza]|uniref:uncharacterized protein LOC131024990 isoform X1 n=1 Tax=Salvia miltiorrhiza TaxID=226208 RepID=UPI0025AC24E6|nr:uncharacterized protein LOC131024990 isoform X1 [Salvia miltiorrhiza]